MMGNQSSEANLNDKMQLVFENIVVVVSSAVWVGLI